MPDPRTCSIDPDVERRHANGILDALDARSQSSTMPSRLPSGDRAASRRRFRVAATLRYCGKDQTTIEVPATTRELSTMDVALLARYEFPTGGGLHITLHLPENREVRLTGKVMGSQAVEPGWHLVEIALQTLENAIGETVAEAPRSSTLSANQVADEAPKEASADNDTQPRDDARARTLRMLGGIARHGVPSRDLIAQVVGLTMSADHAVRRATIPALFEIRGHEAQVALISLLRDPNAKIRAEAAETLGRLEAFTAIEPLRELLSQNNTEVALRAAEALGRLHNDSGLAITIRLLRTDHEFTRLAAQAFGAIVGLPIRPSRAGVAEARRNLKNAKARAAARKRGGR